MEKKILTKEEVIRIGKKLADAGLIVAYPPRSHSHNVFSLFPQTSAQYDWLRRECGTTCNKVVLYPVEKVLAVCPELEGYVRPTKSRNMCRIDISL